MPNDTLSEAVARQRIVVLVGLPGSGKSTYAQRSGVTPISSDLMRQLLADDATDVLTGEAPALAEECLHTGVVLRDVVEDEPGREVPDPMLRRTSGNR